MNEEICCITNEGKMAKNQWENDSNFLPVLYIVYKKLGQFFLHTLLANLFNPLQPGVAFPIAPENIRKPLG